uniref:Protease inhibitor n=1 Tax=Triatoma infestans TaxID=30076 RepID=A0A161M2N0_TRIIF
MRTVIILMYCIIFSC